MLMLDVIQLWINRGEKVLHNTRQINIKEKQLNQFIKTLGSAVGLNSYLFTSFSINHISLGTHRILS